VKKITENRKLNLINAIQFVFEDPDDYDLNEWEQGFLEDIQKRLQKGSDLTRKQYDKLMDIISA